MYRFLSKSVIYLILGSILFLKISATPSSAAARFSGTIISIDPNTEIYVLQLADGSKKRIKMKANASTRKSSGGSFSIGEYAVFSIISPLNDDPLVAESIMDEVIAKKTAPAAYTIPSNTRVGGFASSGGPSAMGGTNPNILANVAQGGGNLTPPMVINAPFTASPSPSNSPFTGQVMTNPGGNSLNNQPSNSYLYMMNGQTPITASPSVTNNPFTDQSITLNSAAGHPPQANQEVIITGQQNFQATPANMMMDQPQNNDSFSGGINPSNPINMMIESKDDDDENQVSMFGDPENEFGMSSLCQLNGRIMEINYTNNVIFFMELGTQELGSAVITPQTQMIDGQTKQPINIRTLPKGSIVVISGFKTGGKCIQASNVLLMQR